MLTLIATATVSQREEPRNPTRADIYQVLSHDRRRYVIHHLLQQEDNTATKYELSKQIAAWENGVAVSNVTSSQRKRVYIALHQNHLPLMADRDVVKYSDSGDQVVLADGVEDIDLYLDVVRGKDIPWSQFYIGLGVTGSAAATAGWAGLLPFSLLAGHGWAIVVGLAMTITGSVHSYVTHKRQFGECGPPPELESQFGRD
jgi:hypothetical protein